jgi:hypothetical protein
VSPVVGCVPTGNLQAVDGGGEPRRLGLEVRFETRPIQGRLYDRESGGRLDREFSGWLGLMSAIEAARGGDPAAREEREGERR